jgi:hypothetical protein
MGDGGWRVCWTRLGACAHPNTLTRVRVGPRVPIGCGGASSPTSDSPFAAAAKSSVLLLLSNQRPAPIQIDRRLVGWLGAHSSDRRRGRKEEEEAAPTKYYKYKISKQALACFLPSCCPPSFAPPPPSSSPAAKNVSGPSQQQAHTHTHKQHQRQQQPPTSRMVPSSSNPKSIERGLLAAKAASRSQGARRQFFGWRSSRRRGSRRVDRRPQASFSSYYCPERNRPTPRSPLQSSWGSSSTDLLAAPILIPYIYIYIYIAVGWWLVMAGGLLYGSPALGWVEEEEESVDRLPGTRRGAGGTQTGTAGGARISALPHTQKGQKGRISARGFPHHHLGRPDMDRSIGRSIHLV